MDDELYVRCSECPDLFEVVGGPEVAGEGHERGHEADEVAGLW